MAKRFTNDDGPVGRTLDYLAEAQVHDDEFPNPSILKGWDDHDPAGPLRVDPASRLLEAVHVYLDSQGISTRAVGGKIEITMPEGEGDAVTVPGVLTVQFVSRPDGHPMGTSDTD